MCKYPLISVVIPIYNVEMYLSKCIESVLNQTYKNIEIILVDDGSPDRCGKICDEYSMKDDRIIVIHQRNRGLSGARTAGQKVATGKYITFIDSDDWISDDMIEQLYSNIQNSGAEIAVTGFYEVYENNIFIKSSKSSKINIFNKIETLEIFLFNHYITPTIWGKLWLRSLWDGIYCPEGKLFEDQYTTYKLFDRANKIIFDPTPRYYYRKRKGSIGHSSFSKKTYDLYYAINEEFNFITKKYPEIVNNLIVAKITWELVFINMMISVNYKDIDLIKNSRIFARKNKMKVIKCKYISTIRKIQILLFSYNIQLYKYVYKLYKNKYKIS